MCWELCATVISWLLLLISLFHFELGRCTTTIIFWADIIYCHYIEEFMPLKAQVYSLCTTFSIEYQINFNKVFPESQ